MKNSLINNSAGKRYEMDFDGQIVFADYEQRLGHMLILHVEAPPALRGRDAAGKFMQALMEELCSKQLQVVPVCSYAALWISRHNEFQDILATN